MKPCEGGCWFTAFYYICPPARAEGTDTRIVDCRRAIDDDFMLIFGDTVFEANLQDVVRRQREDRADAAFLVEEVP